MNAIDLSDGTHINCQDLDEREYYDLLKKTGNPVPRYEKEYGLDVRILEDGKVLIKESDYYTLYFSLDDLEKVLMDSVRQSGGRELMLNKNIYGSLFPEKTSELIGQLCIALKISKTPADVELLTLIDRKIDALQDPLEFKRQYFINLCALIGEAYIGTGKAQWKMKLSDDGVTWNPYLIIKKQEVNFFVYLYEDIFLVSANKERGLLEIYETIGDIERYNL